MPPVNWLAGWVQLWFSIAITKTVLTSCALALVPPSAARQASVASEIRHLAKDIWYPHWEDSRRTLQSVEITPDDSRRQRAALQWIAGVFFGTMMGMLRSEDSEEEEPGALRVETSLARGSMNRKCRMGDSTGGWRLVRAKKAMEPTAPVSRFLYRG